MVFGDLDYEDHLVRNSNDYSYQFTDHSLVDNLKFTNHSLVDNLKFNLQTTLDNIIANIRTAYENYKQNINEYNNQYGTQEPLFKLDLNPPVTQNNIIHEEFAEKEKRIRHLESIQIENTNEISRVKAEKLEDGKKIKALEKKIEKLENNLFLKWMMRATEDCKKEKIF